MSAKHTTIFSHGRGKQRGVALMIMLVIMVMGAAAIFVSSLNRSALQNARNKVNADALAQAKDALIGYAVAYADKHSGETYGYLPCPDIDGSDGEGVSRNPSCGSKNVSELGRLPWKSLDLAMLSDSSGECLWYAVSGTYKSSLKTDMMNWDNNGQFQVLAASGVMLAGQSSDSNAVAVVFAPGIALSDQSQSHTPGSAAPICNGNYTAGNYLDRDTTISANNAAPSTVANAISQFFNAGATANINDQIIFITKNDIFNAIKKRNDFDTFVTTLLSAAKACLSTLPTPVTVDFNTMSDTTVTMATGSLYVGRIPSSALTSCTNNNLVKQWRDNLLYATCTSGDCLTGSNDGVIIFTGEKSASMGQRRITNADKNTWSNYLEDTTSPYANILTAFTTGATTFSGASSYDASSPSTDVVAFIP